MTTGQGYSGNAVSGAKYDTNRWMSATEIAKGIRADIKAAVAAGDLPKTKYSVTSQSFSGGQSVSIRLPDVADEDLFEDVPADEDPVPGQRWAAEWRAVSVKLHQIGNAYTHRDIDSQTDYFDVSCYINVYFRGGLCGPSH